MLVHSLGHWLMSPRFEHELGTRAPSAGPLERGSDLASSRALAWARIWPRLRAHNFALSLDSSLDMSKILDILCFWLCIGSGLAYVLSAW